MMTKAEYLKESAKLLGVKVDDLDNDDARGIFFFNAWSFGTPVLDAVKWWRSVH